MQEVADTRGLEEVERCRACAGSAGGSRADRAAAGVALALIADRPRSLINGFVCHGLYIRADAQLHS